MTPNINLEAFLIFLYCFLFFSIIILVLTLRFINFFFLIVLLQIRMSAITYLQRALLVHDLQTLSGPEWEACFNKVLFPLLSKLLEPLNPNDPSGVEETRMRAATVLSKVR